MLNVNLLKMLNEGRIEEAKGILKEEIYKASLQTKTGAHKRYSAMKKYFTYRKSSAEYLNKPCKDIKFNGETYTAFTNSWSLIFTKEDIGEIESFDTTMGKYPKVEGIMRLEGEVTEIDISEVTARAKSQGYKLLVREVGMDFKYLMKFDESYYKIGLLQASYDIIADGKPAKVYKVDGANQPLTIETDYGYCVIMPVAYVSDPDYPKVIIEVD